MCLVGGDLAGGQHDVERSAPAHEAWETLGTAGARDEAEFDLGKPELRVRTADPQGAGHCEFEAAPEREAVHRGDRDPVGGREPV